MLIQRLYGEEAIRVMTTEAVAFECSCSAERTARALVAIDPVELEALFSELGTVSMLCEFCQMNYAFNRESLADLVRGAGTTH